MHVQMYAYFMKKNKEKFPWVYHVVWNGKLKGSILQMSRNDEIVVCL